MPSPEPLICKYLLEVKYPDYDESLVPMGGNLMFASSKIPMFTGRKSIFGRELSDVDSCKDCDHMVVMNSKRRKRHYCNYQYNK
jgi:hypothetical protein